MGLPEFNKRGTLDKGIHPCKSQEFFERFCYGNNTVRSDYRKVLEQLFAFAVSREAKSIIIGGSFVTNKERPKDLDCIVIVPNANCQNLQTNELLVMNDCELDVLILDENRKETVYAFLNMFGKDRYNLDVGMVEILLDEELDSSTWDDYAKFYSFESLLEAREAYIHRHVVRGVEEKKVLVTICNLEEFWHWNYEIAPAVSASGWIFAPFVYHFDKVKDSVEGQLVRLRRWLQSMYYLYDKELCVYADGLGAFLLGKFMEETEVQNVYFDKIILTRALLNKNFNWKKKFDERKVNYVISFQDRVAEGVIAEMVPSVCEKDIVFGTAYKEGFVDFKSKGSFMLECHYKYENHISHNEFQSRILPMYHVSGIIQDNIADVYQENIMEMYKRDVSLSDANLQAASFVKLLEE